MSDIVARLHAMIDANYGDVAADSVYGSAMSDAADEITRLRVQNIQMQAALGYAICAEDERHIIPSNPYNCGVCEANKGIHAEIDRLRSALDAAQLAFASESYNASRLRSALRPFAAGTNSEDYIKTGPDNGLCAAMSYEVKHYRDARAALGEKP